MEAPPDTRPGKVFAVEVRDWGVRVDVVRACGKTGRCCRTLVKADTIKRAGPDTTLPCMRCGTGAATVREFIAENAN